MIYENESESASSRQVCCVECCYYRVSSKQRNMNSPSCQLTKEVRYNMPLGSQCANITYKPTIVIDTTSRIEWNSVKWYIIWKCLRIKLCYPLPRCRHDCRSFRSHHHIMHKKVWVHVHLIPEVDISQRLGTLWQN